MRIVVEIGEHGQVTSVTPGAEAWLYRIVDGVATINMRVPLPNRQALRAKERYPSTCWDTDEWVAAFDRDPSLLDRLLAATGRITDRFLSADDPKRQRMCSDAALKAANEAIPNQRKGA